MEQLEEIELQEPPQQPDPPTKKRALYDAVSKKYNLGSYEEYETKLKDPTKRKALYDFIGKEYELGTYQEFESKISEPSKKKVGSVGSQIGAEIGGAVGSSKVQSVESQTDPLKNQKQIFSGLNKEATDDFTKLESTSKVSRKPIEQTGGVVGVDEIMAQQRYDLSKGGTLDDNRVVEKPPTQMEVNQRLLQQKGYKKNVDIAIDNTTKEYLRIKGIKAREGSSIYEEQKQKIQKAFDEGDVAYHMDLKTNTPRLDKITGWWSNLAKGWNEATTDQDEANYFAEGMTRQERVEYANQKYQEQAEKPPSEYLDEREGGMGAVGHFVGGASPFLLKAVGAAALGTMAVAAAPVSMGASLAALPVAASFLFTANDMKNTGIRNEVLRRYEIEKRSNPNISDEEAMALAESGELSGGIRGIIENALFMKTMKLPISNEGKKAIGKFATETLQSGVNMGAVTAATDVAQKLEGIAEGYETTPKEVAESAINTFLEQGTNGMLLHGMVHGSRVLPKAVKSAFKFALSKVPKEEIHQTLQANVELGTITPEQAAETMKDIDGYNEALSKINTKGLSETSQASIAGLIQAKENLKVEAETKDESVRKPYEDKIEAINQQIADIQRTNKPLEFEVDDVTGNTLVKPTFDEVAKQRVEDVADKISKGKAIEDIVDVQTEAKFPEQLEKQLNKILREEKSSNKDKEKPNTEISDNVNKYLEQNKEVVTPTPTEVKAIKPDVMVSVKLDGKDIDAKYLDEYKGQKIVEIDGDVYAYNPKTEVLFKVALDDSKTGGNVKKVNPEANNVQSAKEYIDWATKTREENKFVPIPIKGKDDGSTVSVVDVKKEPIKLRLSGKFANTEAADNAVNEIKGLGEENQFNDKQVVIDNVKVTVERDGGKIWLKEISAIEQGKGEGTKVLNKLKEIADKNNVDIILHPTAIKNTTEKQLTDWYIKNGFEDYTQGRLIYKSKEVQTKNTTNLVPRTTETVKAETSLEEIGDVGTSQSLSPSKGKEAEKPIQKTESNEKEVTEDTNATAETLTEQPVVSEVTQPTGGKKEPPKEPTEPVGEGGKPPFKDIEIIEDMGDKDLSGIRKALVSDKIIEGVDLEKVGDKEMMALGRKILDTGEVKPEALVTKIIEEGKGVLTPTEVVGLITYKRDIDTALQDVYKQLAEKKAKGEDIGTLGVEAKNLERQINDFDVMAVITAQQQSMAFRLRQRMLDREYNVVTQIEKYKANNNGEIPAEIEAKFRDLDKQIKEVKAKLIEAEKKLAEKEGQEAVDNIKESVGREKTYTEEELQAELKKERASLRAEKKSKVHKSIDELMDKWAKKITPEHLKGTNTKGVDAEKVFKSVGAVMKKAYDAGETVSKIVEDAVNFISEKLGNKDWGIEEFKKENWEEKLKATTEKKVKDKPTINEDGTVSIPNEMLRDLVKRGITDINDLTKAVHDQVKKELPDITERQVRDYITDYGKKVNPTADQLQQQVNTAKRVGRLLSELEDVQNKIKKNKGSNNIKLTDKERELKRQINALSKDIFGKEEKSPEQRLADAKERIKQRISDLTLKIKKKDFSKPVKKLQPTDAELVELNRQKELLQEQFDKEQYKLELKNRKWWQKAEDIALEIFTGISRTLVAGVDLSAGLVQGAWRLYRDPKMSMKAFGESLKQFASEKRNEEWFSKLKASGAYPIIKASKLAVTDEHGRVSVKEGMFITNWANAIYNGLANVATLGYKPAANWVKLKNPIKASQRAFDGYINYVRVAEFVKLAEQAQKDGYTFESNPKIFEKLADHVNTTTGRGSMGALETSSKWLSVAMFAPRKVISEIKLFTPYAFAYYAKQPSYVRKKALLDFAKFVGSYVAVNTSIWAANNAYKDDDDETKFNDNFWNMNSSDFMTHKFGKTRVQLGGQGAKSALVFMSRLFTGKFTDQNGNTSQLGNRYGKQVNTKWDLIMNYGKGKASPGAGAVIKKLDERKGLEVDDVELTKDLTIPMWMQDANELYKEHPTIMATMFNVLSILGAGVRVAELSEKQKVNEGLIKDPTYKFYSDKGVNFPELNPEKIVTKKVNNKNVESLNEYDQDTQDKFIAAKKKYLKEGLQELKDGYRTIYVDEDGGVSMPTTEAGQEGKDIIAFDKLTAEQLQALVSELGEQATEKTKEEIDLKTRKKKQ